MLGPNSEIPRWFKAEVAEAVLDLEPAVMWAWIDRYHRQRKLWKVNW